MTDRAAPTPGLRVGVVCVLYGNSDLPQTIHDLSQLSGVTVAVVDNSNDLIEKPSDKAVIVRPGRNLGYSVGVNRALAELPDDIEALLIVNPDIVSKVELMLELASSAAGQNLPALVAPDGRGGLYGFQARQSVSTTIIQHTFRTSSWPKDTGRGFLSGALLAMNAAALQMLAKDGRLLREELFFMDDVELSDRARCLGVLVTEVPCRGTILHIGGESMRRRPAVRIYFSRVSKVRYWSKVSPARGRLLGVYFLLEATLGWLAAPRGRKSANAALDGTVSEGFGAVVRWLIFRDRSIDEQVLGNR